MKLLRSLKMSRIGKQPIKVPSGVDFKVDGSSVAVKGPKGQLQRNLHPNMKIELRDGYSRQLNIVGVGYKVELKGKELVLNLGHSHAINYPAPEGVEFDVDPKKNTIIVKGANKESVGQTAAEIRSLRPPEPYKGKGVMYSTERIRRKAGKAAAGKG